MHRSPTLIHTSRQALRSSTPSLRRAYPGIKQDDPSLHPTGANSEAAKDKGPLAKSQPLSESNPENQSKSSSNSGTESNSAVNDQQQSQQKGGQQQRGMATSCSDHALRERRKTVAEMDEELRQRMSGHSGDGGAAGIEYENGEPVAMKRGVRNNMFRYI